MTPIRFTIHNIQIGDLIVSENLRHINIVVNRDENTGHSEFLHTDRDIAKIRVERYSDYDVNYFITHGYKLFKQKRHND